MLVAAALWSRSAAGEPNVAFFYGKDPPFEELNAFDVAVLDPEHVPVLPRMRGQHVTWFAYVSLGEAQPEQGYFQRIPRAWLRGRNPHWGSWVIDQSEVGWTRFLLERVFEPLWKAGYRGFFLDNLDSYHLIAKTPEERSRQEEGLSRLVLAIAQRFPGARLIFNRGFEILPALRRHVFAVAAESLWQTWDPVGHSYKRVSAADRDWLRRRLREVKERYGIPVIVVDYAPPGKRKTARRIAKKIEKLGFVPWVANGTHDILGLGRVEVMPRKILMLYDGNESPLEESPLHRLVATPLNYLGYVPEYRDVREPLPDFPLIGRYAGIVAWFESDRVTNANALQQWLVSQFRSGMRVVFLDDFGFPRSDDLLQPFGLRSETEIAPGGRVRVTRRAAGVGYETSPLPDPGDFSPLRLDGPLGEVLVRVEAQGGAVEDAVAITSWGGYAVRPFAVAELPNGALRWVIDPFDFLPRALALTPMPVPDVTTENGRRLLLVHVDADGMASRADFAGAPLAGDVLLREILERYRVPTTVSVITGIVAPNGLYPELSSGLISTARQIFALPHVEIASHSFSHPFDWRQVELAPGIRGYNLPVPNYRYDPETEIRGSVEYINAHLAPRGKKVKVFLWTGECNPDAKALAITYALGIGNMNGGDTRIANDNRSLTAVAPVGIPRNGHFQVYAPNQNDNVYTNNWAGPFYGYRRVIETFRLTDSPRRLKPIDVYYHFFSATKKASLVALREVYDWVLRQAVFPVFASEYVRKAMDFNHVVVAREGDAWLIRNPGSVRELRVPTSMGYPDLSTSSGVAGSRRHENARYLHITNGSEARLHLRRQQGREPYLVEANGRIVGWHKQAGRLRFRLVSHVPLTFSMIRAENCTVYAEGLRVQPIRVSGYMSTFKLENNANQATISCGAGA